MSDGDRLMDVVGILLAVGLIAGVGLLVLAGTGGSGDGTDEVPDANWTAERLNDTHVRIAHAGGEPVDTESLVVTVENTERRVSWSGTLFEGNGGVLEITEGRQVSLYHDEGSSRERLASWNAV